MICTFCNSVIHSIIKHEILKEVVGGKKTDEQEANVAKKDVSKPQHTLI